MNRGEEALIARLAGEARPVRRAAPPGRRAGLWLALAAIVALIVIDRLYLPGTMAQRMGGGWSYVELAATLATGIAAIVAAFNLGVPGRARRWSLAPLPPLILWLIASAVALASYGPAARPPDVDLPCFKFILAAGAPMAIAAIVALRRTKSLRPRRTAFLAGVGTAALATFLLAFCHPFALDPLDLASHVAAILLLVAAVTLLGGPMLTIRPQK